MQTLRPSDIAPILGLTTWTSLPADRGGSYPCGPLWTHCGNLKRQVGLVVGRQDRRGYAESAQGSRSIPMEWQ